MQENTDYLNCGDDYLDCGDDYLDCGDDTLPPDEEVSLPPASPTPTPAQPPYYQPPREDNWLAEIIYSVIAWVNRFFSGLFRTRY